MQKLVKGWGINDADYTVKVKDAYYVDGKRKFTSVWECPYYIKWLSMLERGSPNYWLKKPTYKGVTIHEDWKYFSNFKAWMEKQNWEGLQLDKDILVTGNKHYGPDTCAFVPGYINICLAGCKDISTELPIGVTFKAKSKYMVNPHKYPYVARIGNGTRGKNINLGSYRDAKVAHKAWQLAKIISLEGVVAKYAKDATFNSKVADAIMQRVWQIRLDILNKKETKSL